MKNLPHILFAFLFANLLYMQGAQAQQDPQIAHHMYNKLSVNPGYAGMSGAICATAIVRQQWMGLDGAPNTQILNVHSPIPGYPIGAGLYILNDQYGFAQNVRVKLAGNYHYEVPTGGVLGIGLGFGLHSFGLTNESEWVAPEDDPFQDPAISVFTDGQYSDYLSLDLDFGLYYKTDELYVGLSSTHLNQPNYKPTDAYEFKSFHKRHYYMSAGYRYALDNPIWVLIPSLFIKSDGKISTFDLNALVEYNNLIWGGVSYRAGDAIFPMLGIKLKNGIKAGLAYEFTTNRIRHFSGGSFEFMFGYCFNIEFPGASGEYVPIRTL